MKLMMSVRKDSTMYVISWMKGGAVSNEDAFDTGDESMVCGIVSSGGGGGGGDGGEGGSINWGGNNWALACDFTDGDIGNAQISGAGLT